jgi:hypothetical protein
VPWFGLVLLACALLALAGGIAHRPVLSAAAAAMLLVAWLPPTLKRRSAAALGAWLVAVLLLLVPAAMGNAALALQAMPAVFLSMACWLFVRTLLPGGEPLVSRLVRLLEGDARLDLPGVRAYTHGVTLFWATLLGGMALLSLAIALLAVPGGWLATLGVGVPVRLPGALLVWYPEAGCWALLAAGFVGEYLFRRWYLRAIPHPGARHFAGQLIRCWPMLLQGGDERA